MCGIAGIYERNDVVRDGLLLVMAGELRHRGPDGVGLYLDRQFGMVNTRLSIVDVAGGDQPIGNEDGRYWVMQNGEIYNAPELQAELEQLGHRFQTRCDTEVLVHAYEAWGVKCLHHFNGAFAFAIWDERTRELFLARDRFGIRPLFLADDGGTLRFASEAKALLRDTRLVRAIDPLGLVETFTLWGCAPDRSAMVGVRELAPGHYLRWGPDGPIEERCWWDLAFGETAHTRTATADDLADELLALLQDATALRLRADVPVGAYLSGGLDSSMTAALVRRTTSQTLRSFAIRFADPLFDETPFQDRMARELGTELSAVHVDAHQIAEIFPEVVRLAEKPLLRTAPAPLLMLSGLAREHAFKVVLTGEGADEVFAGYNIFRENKVRRFWARHPESTMRPRLLERLYPYLARDLGRAAAFTRGFFGKHLTETDDPLYSHRLRFENTARLIGFLDPGLVDAAATTGSPEERLRARLPLAFAEYDPLSRAQYLEIKTFLQGYLLHSQGDRMLMGNSVEGRFPFLDHRVAEFAATIPDELRLRGLREKYLLRRAAAGLVPPEIAARDKRPYRAPILRAFVGDRQPAYVREMLDGDGLARTGLFDAAAVGKLVGKCERRIDQGVTETDEMALVGVLSTVLLHDALVARPALAPASASGKTVVARATDQSRTPA